VNSVNPGFVATNLFRKLPGVLEKVLKQFTDSVEEGVRPILYCAVGNEMKDVTGHYIGSTCRRKWPNQATQDSQAGITLWQMSEGWLGDVFREEKKSSEVSYVPAHKMELFPEKMMENEIFPYIRKDTSREGRKPDAEVPVVVKNPETEASDIGKAEINVVTAVKIAEIEEVPAIKKIEAENTGIENAGVELETPIPKSEQVIEKVGPESVLIVGEGEKKDKQEGNIMETITTQDESKQSEVTNHNSTENNCQTTQKQHVIDSPTEKTTEQLETPLLQDSLNT